MTLPSTIAHYRIVSKLGEGGMGAVYRATDTRLNRDVAIKVLPPAFAEDAGRMQRFEREAQVLASLNHPNIAAIYGIEQNAIVMELVDGADLAGPLPVDTVIQYARQIAAGLEAAHEKGIIHRDLKPANIKVTQDGTVKLLDFGLAKATEQSTAVSTASPTTSPTLSLAMTQAGMILGTAAYMSPEQARGKPVDRRSDIWAFGVILFELLTGKMLFGGGETISDSLAAVLTRDPDWSALPANTPPHIRRLMERCLRKDPKLRLRDIGEARITLDEPPVEPAAAPAAAPARSAGLAKWLAALSSIGLLGIVAWLLLRPAAAPEVLRFPVGAGKAALGSQTYSGPVISPDGRQIAYISEPSQGRRQIFVRRLDSLEPQPVAGTSGVDVLAWSPDSRRICFLADSHLRIVDVKTGARRNLADGVYLTRLAWSEQGVLLFTSPSQGPLLKMPEAGGTPAPATTLDTTQGEIDHDVPAPCPDGRHFLFLARHQNGPAILRLGTLDSPGRSIVLGTAGPAACASVQGIFGRQDYLIELGADALSARRIDLSSGTLGEQRWLLASGPAFQTPRVRAGAVGAANNGTIIYWMGSTVEGKLIWYDRSGQPLETLPSNGAGTSPTLSADERFVAVSRAARVGNEIWVTDLARKTSSPVQFSSRIAVLPAWSPDGKRLAFACEQGLCEGDISGAGEVRVLNPVRSWPQQYTADGRNILFVNVAKLALEMQPVEGGQAVQIGAPGVNYYPASIAPGGGFYSYTSSESGTPDVYVRAMPPAAGKWPISTGGGGMAAWRGDGKELYYLSADSRLMAVDIQLTPSFQAGTPHALFKADTLGVVSGRNLYVPSKDAKRFLMYTPVPESQTDPANVVTRLSHLSGHAPGKRLVFSKHATEVCTTF